VGASALWFHGGSVRPAGQPGQLGPECVDLGAAAKALEEESAERGGRRVAIPGPEGNRLQEAWERGLDGRGAYQDSCRHVIVTYGAPASFG
jgi:hypothetical protein